jgi:predicted TPR repeat methyltransferase
MNDAEDHEWLKQGSTSSGEVQKIYDEWAASYDETLETWDYRAPTEAARLLRAKAPAGSVILDAGCGTGLTGVALRAAGFTGPIDGVDLSPPSLSEADKHGVYRALTAMNLQTPPLPIPENTYDAVICVGVMTYIPDCEGVLREFARVAKSGGWILITQRDDLFRERGYDAALRNLADVVNDVTISEPLPYLPDNPDFGAEIKVIYIMMKVI